MNQNLKKFIVILSVSLLAVGCVSNKRHNREINNIQNQVNSLSSEVARLDSQASTQKPAGLGFFNSQPAQQAASQSGHDTASYVSTAMYRTPGGFEVPAADIQRALTGAGYFNGEIDGKIGPKTREAIRSFQKNNGVKADGICGKKTWELLSTHLAAGSAQSAIK